MMFDLVPFRRKNAAGTRGFISPWEEFDRAFERLFSGPLFPSVFGGGEAMKVDIKETENEYVVEAEIPGAKKENIKLELDGDVLTIRVEHNEQVEEEGANYIRKERKTAGISRSFYVENVNGESATDKYDNGVLKVILPKRDKGWKRGKQIDIA